MVQKNSAERGRGPQSGIVSVFFLVFFRQCALAALKDVHNYLSHEEGHVAVKKFSFFPFLSARMENS